MKRWKGACFLVLLVLADQATKLVALAHLDPDPNGTAVRIVRGAVYLKLSRNAGGVWGLLEGLGPAFFIIVTALVVAFLAVLLLRLRDADRPFAIPLLLLLGGFAGNGIDRARLGHVVDFIYMTWYSRFMVSTFNLADLAILAGLAWMIVVFLRRAARSRRAAKAGAD
jgi:signal peptidase II